ncbi:hypothetical protein U1Q18_009394 [Sarracenia purpurea var. burkii]
MEIRSWWPYSSGDFSGDSETSVGCAPPIMSLPTLLVEHDSIFCSGRIFLEDDEPEHDPRIWAVSIDEGESTESNRDGVDYARMCAGRLISPASMA